MSKHIEFFSINYISRFLDWFIKRRLFQRLTKNALPVFTKGGDIISINTQIRGVHEAIVTAFISYCARIGFNEFFLDIGANIGITSCQNGNDFNYIHLYEPNPLCQKILEVNTSIILNRPKIKIHKYALGSSSYSATLFVPRHNWGGGYIVSPENTYNMKMLVNKDGFSKFEESNYLSFNVEIRDSKEEFDKVFKELNVMRQTKGIIKIDTEGFEPIIIQGIAAKIPNWFECYIVFESFNPEIDINHLLDMFNGRATAYKISEIKPFGPRWPKVLKLLTLLFKRKSSFYLNENIVNSKGDLVMKISGIESCRSY